MTCEYLWVRGEHAQFPGFIFVEALALDIGNIKWLKRSASTATLSYLVALLPQNSRQPLNSLILRHLQPFSAEFQHFSVFPDIFPSASSSKKVQLTTPSSLAERLRQQGLPLRLAFDPLPRLAVEDAAQHRQGCAQDLNPVQSLGMETVGLAEPWENLWELIWNLSGYYI